MANPNQRIHVSGFLKLYLWILRAICYYYQEPGEPLWYIVYSAVTMFLYVVAPAILNLIKIIKCLIAERDPEILARGFTNVTYTSEVYCFLVQKNNITQVFNDMDSDIFQPRNEFQRAIIRRQMLKAKRFIDISMWVTCALCFLYGIKPRIRNDTSLPMNVWYPVDTSKSPAYWIVYVYEYIFMMLHACSHVSLASIPILSMAFLIGQLNMIADTLRKLKEYAEEDAKTDNKKDNTVKTHVEMKKLLIQCVYKHRALRRLVIALNKVYTYHFLMILSNAIIGFALLLYQLSTEGLQSIITATFHIATLMTQLLLYNWYGNEVTFKSDTLYIAAYSMDWPGTPVWFQKDLLFALIHFQIPMKIYACNFFLLCLESYVGVLRTSWSYFLLLTNMNEE